MLEVDKHCGGSQSWGWRELGWGEVDFKQGGWKASLTFQQSWEEGEGGRELCEYLGSGEWFEW